MQYSKKGWDIISDIIRELGENPGMLNECETNIFLEDIANLIDYMCKGKTFKSALKAYREEDPENASWAEKFLERLGIEL